MTESREHLEALERHGMLTNASDQNALEAMREKDAEGENRGAMRKKDAESGEKVEVNPDDFDDDFDVDDDDEEVPTVSHGKHEEQSDGSQS